MTDTVEREAKAFAFGVRQFVNLGFTVTQAETLMLIRADWHDAEDLIKRGCPVDIAFDLLT